MAVKKPSWLVAIGTSAGGLDALARLLPQLAPDFPGSIFIAQHMPADVSGEATLRALRKVATLECSHAHDGEPFKPGRVYLAPTDQHMMVKKTTIMVTKGARENGWRPAIDPLFRSVAVAHGNRAIGVVLTGYLDDGTAGLVAIKRCGGKCVVQDPRDAAYPDMPQNALAQVKVDHCVPIAEMGAVLTQLAQSRAARRSAPPEDIAIEAKIAERVLSDLPSVEAVGEQVPYNCPGCGGVLWQVKEGDALRYRCHTGHAYTAPVLLAQQSAKIEETLWIALRMFEERRNLLATMASQKKRSDPRESVPGAGNREVYASTAERAKEAAVHVERIRALLRVGGSPSRGRRR